MAQARSGANKWIISATVILGTYVAVIDVTIVNVAMPQMIGTFGVSLDAITWVAVSYSIAEIVMVTMASWFTRLMGRKNFYVVCLTVFTLASVLSGLSRSLEMMIFTRVLQGLGGGGAHPNGTGHHARNLSRRRARHGHGPIHDGRRSCASHGAGSGGGG